MLAQEPELDDQQPQETGQGNSAHDPPSESESPSAPCARPVPKSNFDMIDFMHQSASYDMQQVLQQAEDLPPIPPHVFSERSGGEARRVMLKSRTSTVTRSVSEVFAYSTSRTIKHNFCSRHCCSSGDLWKCKQSCDVMHSSLMLFIIIIVHRILMQLRLLIVLIVLIVFTASIQPKRYTFQDNAYNE